MTSLFIGWWAVSASVLALLARWFEIAFAWVGAEFVPTTAGSALLSGALLPALTVAMGGATWALLRAGKQHPGVAVAGGGIVIAVFGSVVTALRPYAFSDAWDLGTASAMAADLLWILSAALVAHVGITLLKGYLRVLAVCVAGALSVATLVLLAVAVAYVVGLQNPIDPAVLWYTLISLNELRGVAMSEMDAAGWAVLAVGIFLVSSPLLSLAIPRVRQRLFRPVECRGVGSALWTVVPIITALALLPTPPVLLGNGVLMRLVSTLSAPDLVVSPALAAAHRFDTRNARLAPVADSPIQNVVVVVLESHRRDATTPYAPELDTTPYLDELAHRGRVVEEMYAVVPHTNKSLVSIFGGVYPRLTPDFAANQPGGIPARGLPAMLASLGYATAFFTPATMEYEAKGQILDNLGFGERYGDGDFSTSGFVSKSYFGYEDRIVLDSAHAWIDRKTKTGTPFFLGLLTLSSHHPYKIPAVVPASSVQKRS